MNGWGAAVAKFLEALFWGIKRRADHNDKPETKDAKRREQVENEILNDDEDAANARVADDLFRLRMHRNAKAANHPERPGNKESESKPKV
jgi:hypothetical protein